MTIHQMGRLSMYEDKIQKRYSGMNSMMPNERLKYMEKPKTTGALMPDIGYASDMPVSDKVKQKIIDTVRSQAVKNGNGVRTSKDEEELAKIYKDYSKNLKPMQKMAVNRSLEKIASDENERIVNYIKTKKPAYKAGAPFDTKILTDSDFGTKDPKHFEVKV